MCKTLHFRWIAAGLMAVGCLSALGCGTDAQGPQMFDVTGKVTYQGKPVGYGHVTLVGEQGPPSPPAVLKDDGTFSTRAVPGAHKVVVQAIPPAEGGKPDPLSEGGVDYSQAKPAKSLVPLKYARAETSDVTVEITADETPLHIALH